PSARAGPGGAPPPAAKRDQGHAPLARPAPSGVQLRPPRRSRQRAVPGVDAAAQGALAPPLGGLLARLAPRAGQSMSAPAAQTPGNGGPTRSTPPLPPL